MIKFAAFAGLCLSLLSTSAHAQSDPDAPSKREPRRYRIALGIQLVPSFAGADRTSIKPLWDFNSARGDDPFPFEAADESTGFTVLEAGRVEFGPALSFENGRNYRVPGIGKVGNSFEVGGFAQTMIRPDLRARIEIRRGLGGHEAWVGVASVDYIARKGDSRLFSIGPRVTLGDARYQRSYFGVSPAEAAATGLAAYRPDAGIHAIGANIGYLHQLSDRWTLHSYARYDRLTGDAADSPLVRAHGSRDQFSTGIGIGYTFARRR
ncbi:MipA/OmpV family protein [Sphingomonas sp. G-3-2-10]|uniref:MipA/OmpV family protein n=1 Tax=Sphingomonas sp. G-3-2-10 TaxID=2728838 RepID=UPI00146C7335|nr:MipA/OmpV family protein [Sphingomonas sp. G-3-2-10]NML04493.1 MipA/OmpV family protein [Sphingomonas sp. G-3-2-10]